jgi:hypothetical protein
MSDNQKRPKLSANNRLPTIPVSELQKVRDIWLHLYHTHGTPAGGNAELWIHAVEQLQAEIGCDVITVDIRKGEAIVAERGLMKDYLKELTEIIEPNFGALADDTYAFILMTASAEERRAALKAIGVLR